MKKHSFRMWCQEKWFEHKDELESYGQALDHTAQQYFTQYKFWLRREYRHQQENTELCKNYFLQP